MAEPRRRRRQNYAAMNSYAPSGSHPFLTERGLWLQQNGRTDMPAPMPLPQYAPGQPYDGMIVDSESGLPIDEFGNPIAGIRRWDDSGHLDGSAGGIVPAPNAGSPRIGSSDAPLLGRFDDRPLDPGTLQNIRASKRFPNPAVLRRMPLTSLYKSQLASTSSPSVAAKKQLAAVGKVVIRLAGDRPGLFASGSAWVSGPNTIVTCAHNLYDSNTGRWSLAIEFYPGYDFYATKPLPACRVVSGVIPSGYLQNPLTNHDLAICKVDRNIGDMIGTEIPLDPISGIEFFEQNQVLISGYPAGSGFDFGKQLWQSRGEFLFGMSGGGGDDFAPAVATDFGGGASGCPWLAHDAENDRLVAVGVTSGHARLRYDPGEPNLMSLTSPLMNQRTLDRINDDSIEHRFLSV